MNRFEIHIGLFGCVSVGKSTFLNAIAGQQFSDTEIKKTTMVPQVYVEADNATEVSDALTIRKINREINEQMCKIIDQNQFTIDKCQPLYHKIDRICDIFDPQIIDTRLKITIDDIPGLNDCANKDIYFRWVQNNIKYFDIIIFITDINRGLNNSDEIEILDLLMSGVKKYNSRMICLMNKCDDIYYDDGENDLVFEEKEQQNIYIQANNILADIRKKYGFEPQNDIVTPFYPISSENCFIYRALLKNPMRQLDQIHINRLCKNECGPNQWKKMDNEQKNGMFHTILQNLQSSYDSKIRDTGYLEVKTIIQKTLASNKTTFIQNRLYNNLDELESYNFDDMSNFIGLIKKYTSKISQAENLGISVCYDSFWQKINTSITKYIDNITKIDTKIIKYREFINFAEFENLHSALQIHCMNFSSLMECIRDIPDYPTDLINAKYKILVDRLLDVYEQIACHDHKECVHTCPSNLLNYLQTIKIYAQHKFGIFAIKFLNLSCNPQLKHCVSYQTELTNLIIYIVENIQSEMQACYAMIVTILIGKQTHLMNKSSPDQYFSYLIKMKKLVESIYKDMPINEYSAIDILLEVTNKNISISLSSGGIYNQQIDYCKVNSLLDKFLDGSKPDSDMEFEKRILAACVEKSR